MNSFAMIYVFNKIDFWRRFLDGFKMEWEYGHFLRNLEFAGQWSEEELSSMRDSLVKAISDLWSDAEKKSQWAFHPKFRCTMHHLASVRPMEFVLNLH